MKAHSHSWFRGVAALALLACAVPSFGWGGRGHRGIDQAAVLALPADGPNFLRQQLDYIGDSASLPDSWRQQLAPFSRMDEDPNHGWFKEQFSFLKPIPRSRYAFVLALYRERQHIVASDPQRAARMNVRWTGTLPYAVVEGYGRLVTGFRSYRQALAQHQPTASIETTCAFYVAWTGHYVGDGAQPLHVSIQHDGWVGANPHGYTTDHRIHSRFESRFVNSIGFSASDLDGKLPPLGHQSGDVFEQVLAYLDDSQRHVEEVYQLDLRHAFDQPDSAAARALVYQRTAAGAGMLRDLIYRAWRESALPPVKIDPALEDPDAPGYDPDTGSAPAPLSRDVPAG